MTPQLPAGYTARPAVREDAEAVVSLLHAYSLAVSGEIENSLKGLLGEWNVPDLDLARDSLVVFAPDGRLIAYSVVWNKSHPVLPFVNVFLHASEWDRDTTTCSFLLAWGEARVLENLPQRVGMHVHNRYTLFEKELRPGIDPSTTEVGAAVTVSEAP